MRITKLFTALILFLVIFNSADAQIRTRETAQWYAGAGYSFVIFNNSQMSDAYPLFSKSGDFLKEVNFFGGVKINRSFTLEFSPSFMFTSSSTEKGFSYTNASGVQRFYVPTQTSFLSIPLNLKGKFYPFTQNQLSFMSDMYLGLEAGTVYVKEEVNQYIYSDNTMTTFIGSQRYENSFWTPDFGISIGYGNTQKVGYGFEAAYRIIPLKADNKFPLPTSIAKDMNSINLTVKIIFGFQ